MIEKLLSFCARLWLAAQANSFGDRTIDQITFGCCLKDFMQRSFRSLLINFLQPEISLQPAPADWPLAQSQSGVAVRKLRIVEITILAEPRDDFLDICFRRTASFQEPLAQLFNRTLLGCEQFRRALKDTLPRL